MVNAMPPSQRSSRLLAVRSVLLLGACISSASGWVLTKSVAGIRTTRRHHHSSIRATCLFAADSEILDVDFERVVKDPVRQGASDSTTTKEDEGGVEDDSPSSKSLFEMSLESDPFFRDQRIPFIDYTSSKSSSSSRTSGGGGGGGMDYIDVKLAFMAELDGVQYGIAIPFDAAAAITVEQPDGTVDYIRPSLDENEELMSIMAAQLQEHVGQNLSLQRTPRILTIAGPLGNYTDNWQEKLTPDPIPSKELLDTSDEGLDFFYQFMKDELGEEEYEKTLNETPDEDEMKEWEQLFSVPGLGDKVGDEDMAELFSSLLTPEDDFERAKKELGLNKFLDHEGAALKLVSYVFTNGKSYSLVKLLKPFALIGRYIDEKDDPRFELLTLAEEKLIVPRLEEVCKEDLEKANLKFTP